MTRASDIATYDDDFFAWTQEQAAALRRLPREAIGDAVDIAHVAEEIEDLGKRDLREVASFLARLFEHLMKIEANSASSSIAHWRSEALQFQLSARDGFAPSMRRLLDIEEVWQRGRKLATVSRLAVGGPEGCPFTLDEALAANFDLDVALARLAASPRDRGGPTARTRRT